MRVSAGPTEKVTFCKTGGPSKAMETLLNSTMGAGFATAEGA
jgi:hypothetical protein